MRWNGSSNPTYFVAALPNRDENNQKKAERRTAVVPSFTDALSRRGEKMESQRQWQNRLEREMNELLIRNHAKPQSR